MEINNLTDLQQKIVQLITVRCGSKLVVPVLCELLHLNKSSVYDRLNGKKSLTVEELLVLREHFEINIEHLLQPLPGQLTFKVASMIAPVNTCQRYLKELYSNVEMFAQIPDMNVWFATPSLPFFYHLHFRELALFKLFSYARINWQLPYTDQLVFHPDTFPEKFLYEQLMQPISELFSGVSSVEFWSDDLYYHTLRQIQYFTASGQITDPVVIRVLYEQLEALCDAQSEMAANGVKSRPGTGRTRTGGQSGRFELYYNEVLSTSITLLLDSPVAKGVFTVLDDPNFMFSDDPRLFEYTQHWMVKLRSKCTRLSETGERERRIFFNKIKGQIRAAGEG